MFLKSFTTEKDFLQVWKQEARRHLLQNLEIKGASLGAYFLMDTVLISSIPYNLRGFNLEMEAEPLNIVKCISLKKKYIISTKSGKYRPHEARVYFKHSILAIHSTLSIEVVKSTHWMKRGEIEMLNLFKTKLERAVCNFKSLNFQLLYNAFLSQQTKTSSLWGDVCDYYEQIQIVVIETIILGHIR